MVTSGSAASARDLGPVHAQLAAERGDVDGVAGGEIAHDGAQLGFGRPAPQPPVKLVVERALFRHGFAIEGAVAAVDDQPDALVLGDHRLEREPPQLAEPVGKAGRHIDRERHLRGFEDRISVLQDVAIAVVEGEADEAAAKIARGQAAVHLVERDHVDARAAQQLDHAGQKPRRDFKEPIGLEAVGPRRPHVMHGQNGADAAHQRLQRPMRAGKIQRFQPAADDGVFKPGHVKKPFAGDPSPRLVDNPLRRRHGGDPGFTHSFSPQRGEGGTRASPQQGSKAVGS